MRKLLFLFMTLVLLLSFGTAAQADPYVTLGSAADYAILALDYNGVGQETINSATSISGNVGVASGVTGTTNQKVSSWPTGGAYVSSGATFSYTAATFAPPDGVNIGGASDAKVAQASTDAYAAATTIAGLSATQTISGNINDVSQTVTSNQAVNVIDITGYVNMNSDTFTLNGRAGYTDWFIIRVGGSFDFSQSTVALSNTDAGHVLWFFGDDQHVLVNKSSTVFSGTILAPYESTFDVTYHNPATFTGAIISNNLYVHSDFNITQEGFVPTPIPGAVLLLGAGMVRLVAYARRRQS
jgi:hypothetical protein